MTDPTACNLCGSSSLWSWGRHTGVALPLSLCSVCLMGQRQTDSGTLGTCHPLQISEMNHLTSSKNRGLSGMNFSATREAMQGRAHTSTKTLQLWKWYLVPILNPQPGNSKSQQVKILTRSSEFFSAQNFAAPYDMTDWKFAILSAGGSWRLDSVLSGQQQVSCSLQKLEHAQALPFKNLLLSLSLEITQW